MLLQRLVEYAADNTAAKPFHRERLFSWQLNLDSAGRPHRMLQPLEHVDTRGKARPVAHTTPSMVRTVGVAANLAADDGQYVLGWDNSDTTPSRVAQCHHAFVDLVARWADSERGRTDGTAQAVAAFYRSGAITEVQRPEEYTAKQGVLIAVDGVLAYRAPSVVTFWTSEVARRKGGASEGLCLACGQVRPLLDTVPGKVPARFVPGASNDAALVSINERVFGYGLTTQLGSTPLCAVCGDAVTGALVGLLGSNNAASYGGQDSRMTWWVTGGADATEMHLLDEPDPQRISALMHSVHSSRRTLDDDSLDAMFHSLTVGGNVARVMVRDWVEMPLPDLRANIARWFADHEISARWANQQRHHSIRRLALVSGRWLRRAQRYVELGTKGSGHPAEVHRDLVRAALRGTALPPSLLAHLVHRVCTDGHLDEPRAALIRLALTRSPYAPEKPMTADLDDTNTDPAYVAGRVFAALEQLQYDASGGGLNTTYGDRFFAGAVLNPRAAIVNGRRDANAWLRKLRRTRRGAAVRHEQQLDALFRLIDAAAGLPARTNLAQQSTFLLGYHHQRAHHFASLPTRTTSKETSE